MTIQEQLGQSQQAPSTFPYLFVFQGAVHAGVLGNQGTQLVVHSRNFAAVRDAIRERQIRSPFVYYVPTDDESNSVKI
jgi:hypothetical protein